MELINTINGRKYRYLKIGSGSKKLLYLYGLASYKESVVGLIDSNFPDYTTIVPEYPYHNEFFDSNVEVNSVADIADYLLPLLLDEGFTEFDVIGFSFGGLILLELLSRESQLTINRAVIWASPVLGRDGIADAAKVAYDACFNVSGTNLERVQEIPFLNDVLLTRGIKLLDPVWLKKYLRLLDEWGFGLKDHLAPNRPTKFLLVYDPLEPLIAFKNADYLKKTIARRNVKVVRVRGGGHLGTKQGWGRSISSIKNFLNPGMPTADPDSL
jgi:pimeloyl-ACP methyl ester carboxylesterase